jgi:hypothetical protein
MPVPSAAATTRETSECALDDVTRITSLTPTPGGSGMGARISSSPWQAATGVYVTVGTGVSVGSGVAVGGTGAGADGTRVAVGRAVGVDVAGGSGVGVFVAGGLVGTAVTVGVAVADDRVGVAVKVGLGVLVGVGVGVAEAKPPARSHTYDRAIARKASAAMYSGFLTRSPRVVCVLPATTGE